MLKVIFTIVFIAIVTILIYIKNPQAIDEAIKKVKTLVKKEAPITTLNECEGTYKDWTDWSDWTNDSICPSATDYTIKDSAFNITQSRTRNREFNILNFSSLLTDYSCPEEKDINIKQKETRIYTCPRDCSGVWIKYSNCNAACQWSGKNYDYILSNKGISTRTYLYEETDDTVDATEKMQYIINKTALGKGVVCPEFDLTFKEQKCNKLCKINCTGGNWGSWYGCPAYACLDPKDSSAVEITNGKKYIDWENAIGPFNGGIACPSQHSAPCSNIC